MRDAARCTSPQAQAGKLQVPRRREHEARKEQRTGGRDGNIWLCSCSSYLLPHKAQQVRTARYCETRRRPRVRNQRRTRAGAGTHCGSGVRQTAAAAVVPTCDTDGTVSVLQHVAERGATEPAPGHAADGSEVVGYGGPR